jgi:hypothetical protein
MPLYRITATRETHYEFEIEADNQKDALDEVERIELTENVEDYAIDWYPLELDEIEEEEEVE